MNTTTITVRRYEPADRYGNPGDLELEFEVDLLAPPVPLTEGLGSSQDLSERGREGALELVTLYCVDPDVDIVQTDRILLDAGGDEWIVEGLPARWHPKRPTSTTACAVVQIRRGIG